MDTSWRVRAADLEGQAPNTKSKARQMNWDCFVNLMIDLAVVAATIVMKELESRQAHLSLCIFWGLYSASAHIYRCAYNISRLAFQVCVPLKMLWFLHPMMFEMFPSNSDFYFVWLMNGAWSKPLNGLAGDSRPILRHEMIYKQKQTKTLLPCRFFKSWEWFASDQLKQSANILVQLSLRGRTWRHVIVLLVHCD
jgi:hypothetical protein